MDELELRPGGPPQAVPPTIAQLKTELRYERRRARDRRFAASVLAVLAALAALAVLAGFVWLPVLRIHGRAMEPTLAEGDLVVTLRGKDPKPGSLVYFYIGNELLVRRCIAGPMGRHRSGWQCLCGQHPAGRTLPDGKGAGQLRYRAALPCPGRLLLLFGRRTAHGGGFPQQRRGLRG